MDEDYLVPIGSNFGLDDGSGVVEPESFDLVIELHIIGVPHSAVGRDHVRAVSRLGVVERVVVLLDGSFVSYAEADPFALFAKGIDFELQVCHVIVVHGFVACQGEHVLVFRRVLHLPFATDD